MDRREQGRTRMLLLTALLAAFGVVLPAVFTGFPVPVRFSPNAHSCVAVRFIVRRSVRPALRPSFNWAFPSLDRDATCRTPAIHGFGVIHIWAAVGCTVSSREYQCRRRHLFRPNRAMLSGRVAYGVLNALVLQTGNYSFETWVGVAFVTSFPGIVIQLTVIPGVILLMRKAGFSQKPQ